MPIPPLQSPRSPRDDDHLAGRRGLIGGSRGWTSPSIHSTSAADSDAAFTADPVTSSLQSGDGRAFGAILNDVRDHAAQAAADLDLLGSAGDALARVQRLVGRLRDVAVVAMNVALQPPQRAALQKQVDLLLGEIDVASSDTEVDEDLLRGGSTVTATPAAPSERTLAPFRAIGTATLGLTDLGVRSADQALAATGALDLATTRLQRTGKQVAGATTRLQRTLEGLTSPAITVAGEPALRGGTAALTSAMLLRGHLLSNADQAIQAQADLDVRRARWLLD